MRPVGLIFAFSLVFSTVNIHAEDTQTCTYVVKEMSFENPSGLTAEQVAQLHALVVGRCYDPISISKHVYERLRLWGYKKATVYDPSTFRVLDGDLHPSPIAVAIDFRLRG
jgi:hypothetical protein